VGLVLEQFAERGPLAKRIGGLIATAVLLSGLVWVRWMELPRALPLVSACGFMLLLVKFVRRRDDREAALKIVPLLMWGALAIVLLSKVILNTHIYHYGFYAALPATVFLVILLVWLIPESLKTAGRRGSVFRVLSTGAVMCGVIVYLYASHNLFSFKVDSLANGVDLFHTSTRNNDWRPGNSLRRANSRRKDAARQHRGGHSRGGDDQLSRSKGESDTVHNADAARSAGLRRSPHSQRVSRRAPRLHRDCFQEYR
jgi:hypothetical protein